jgi:hypothetical protein
MVINWAKEKREICKNHKNGKSYVEMVMYRAKELGVEWQDIPHYVLPASEALWAKNQVKYE